ncbi:MAG: baseplate J/gp47 family protein [Anaerolineae bacterium]|nr:baseplate J/gp47 family protein [Anaerolineae bacterium]
MTSNLHILRLEPYDDVVSIRDRLTFVDARRVLLVWPAGAPGLRRKLDLLLVQRQAARLGMWLALVCADPTVTAHAHDLNISVFDSVDTARRTAWQRPRSKVFTARRDPAARAELAEIVAEQRERSLLPTGHARAILRWGLFAGGLLALVIAFFLAAPSATVTLTPANDQVYVRVPIVADPDLVDIDIENYRMPAAVVSLEATSHVTVQSSGRETASASLAQGLITVTNTTDQPVVIPLGSIVTTSGTYPTRFETLIETTIPAGPNITTQVPIQALAEYSGAAGNVDPGAINRIEGGLGEIIAVTNPNATFGGAAQEYATVTADDHARLLVLGRQQVLQRARDTLLHQLSGDQFLVPGSVVIIEEQPEWTIYSAIVGDTAESVSLDFRARVQAVVVDEQQARQVAYSGLAPYIQPGLEVSPDALRFTRGDIQQIEPNGRVMFLMIVEGDIAVSIDEDAVRDRVAGANVGEAISRLQRELLLDPDHPPEIDTWPGWYNRLPVLPVRISVRIETP